MQSLMRVLFVFTVPFVCMRAHASDDSKSPKPKLVKLDLPSAGVPLTMQAPEGSTVRKTVLGTVRVHKGETFDLEIEKGAKSVAAWKNQVEKTAGRPVKF